MTDRARTDDSIAPAVLLGFLLCVIVYIFTKISVLPRFYYLPVEGLWTWTKPANGIAMGYYSLLANSAVAFALGALVGRVPPVRRWIAGPGAGIVPWLALADLWLALCWFSIAEIAKWAAM